MPDKKVHFENKTMKVLFVIDTLQLGGAEKSLLENVARFKQIKAVVCHLYKGDTLKQKFVAEGITVYSFNIKKKYGFIEAYKQLKKVVQNERPQLMVAYLTRSEIVTRLVARFTKIPVVGTFVSDLYSSTYNQHLSWKARKKVEFFKMLNRITGKFCIGFIANSQAIKESNSQQLSIPFHKIQVINRGRDSQKFRFRNVIKKESNSEIRFLNIGRLFPAKGQKELILGFKEFIKTHPPASLHIIGDGPLWQELNTLIKNNELDKKVFLLGTRNDIPQIISDFDCFIFPSFSEGFSSSVIEAIFAGLPVLATNILANKEIITHLKTGYLFNKESQEEITKAMTWYKENRDTANSFAREAYIQAKEKFELETIVQQLELYLTTITNKN